MSNIKSPSVLSTFAAIKIRLPVRLNGITNEEESQSAIGSGYANTEMRFEVAGSGRFGQSGRTLFSNKPSPKHTDAEHASTIAG